MSNNENGEVRKTIRMSKALDDSIKQMVKTTDHVLSESEIIRRAIALGLNKMKEEQSSGCV